MRSIFKYAFFTVLAAATIWNSYKIAFHERILGYVIHDLQVTAAILHSLVGV